MNSKNKEALPLRQCFWYLIKNFNLLLSQIIQTGIGGRETVTSISGTPFSRAGVSVSGDICS